MPNKKKIEQVKHLTEQLKQAKSLVLLNYRGLSHQQMADLRAKLRQADASLMVTKNTLLKLALKSSPLEPRTSNLELSGPTATLFIRDDPFPPLTILKQSLDEFDLPKIKAGILEGQFASKEKILKLADFPSKKALQAQIVYRLKSPNQKLVFALAWNLRKLSLILKNARLKKQN